jgi:hypothetical protein
MPRHEPPERYRQWMVCPKFCHTCEKYNDDGLCVEYDMTPPEDFAKEEDACEAWEYNDPIPF